jgi:hypothetical protein
MSLSDQWDQQQYAECDQAAVEKSRDFWRRAVLNSRVDFEQPTRVDREQRQNQEEEQPFEKPWAAMAENQGDQE